MAVTGSSEDCIDCAAGKYVAVNGSKDCIDSAAGMYVAATGRDNCTRYAFGRFAASTGSDQASDCTPPACPDPTTPCTMVRTTRADGASGCLAGADIDNITVSATAVNTPISCIDCPYKQRYPADGGSCLVGSTGNLCGSCEADYYAAGSFCVLCSDSKVVSVLMGSAVGLVILILVWTQSKFGGLVGPAIKCVISFDSKKGPRDTLPRTQIAEGLRESMTGRFDWAAENILFDRNATTEWAVGIPAMLFSLTQSWCEQPHREAELVWYLVLKTMGADALLQSSFGAFGSKGLDSIRKDDILQNVVNMAPEDRGPLWDGACFVVFSDVSATIKELLRELDCPESHVTQIERKEVGLLNFSAKKGCSRQSTRLPAPTKACQNCSNDARNSPVPTQTSHKRRRNKGDRRSRKLKMQRPPY